VNRLLPAGDFRAGVHVTLRAFFGTRVAYAGEPSCIHFTSLSADKVGIRMDCITRHRLHCCPDAFAFFRSLPFLYISLSTPFFPNVSIRRPLPCLLALSLPEPSKTSTSSPLSAPSPRGISSHSSSSSFRRRFFPALELPLPPPMFMLTRGGTAKPNDFPTLARSSALMSYIFLSE
jgi:hypothetical protein